ncbi:carbohydrate ABC transporter permease [Sphaerochaeta sp. PS]|uniref:carbohydrate ABC transporter permease n=1 Tax=Sphaerochaeta sp. PS TaxID=3076336 RepID=UPI0028A44D8D|nr:carbohydrate ABC transporter permease [Sphaerochaeta sp. PS]MDT4761576.1 carbohydrate ABC transporter permease [Sphaerochaeta sp. PS]
MKELSMVTSMNESYFLKKKIQKVVLYIVLSLIALYTLAPLWLLLVNSFKDQAQIIASPLGLPANVSLAYITKAAGEIHFLKALLTTSVITSLSVLLIVVVSSLAAWMMVRNKGRASQLVFMLFVAAMLIPFQAVMYPLIQFFDDIRLKSAGGLILMYGGFGLSMSVFLYHGFVKGVPKGVEEAATIDGCSIAQMYLHVVMPLLKSITVTVIVLNSMWIWNDYLLPFLVIGNSSTKTLVLELYFARITAGQFGNPWQLIFPAVLISIIPIIIVYLFLQKFIVKGISDGAIKS